MACPSTDLTAQFHPVSTCEIPEVFVEGDVVIPDWLAACTGGLLQDTMVLKPIQVHAIAFAVFASSVAPFGGFLASAIKRANHVKDFDSVIPGHGGALRTRVHALWQPTFLPCVSSIVCFGFPFRLSSFSSLACMRALVSFFYGWLTMPLSRALLAHARSRAGFTSANLC